MTQAGPAIPVVVSTQPPDAGPALRVAVVSDGRPTEAGPARPVVVVSDGRPTQGNEPVPVVAASGVQASQVLAGPPIPVVVVSGGSVLPNMLYTNKVTALNPIAYWPMAESSGSVALDASGNGRNGAYTSVTLGATGIGDGRTAATFNGTSSRNNVFSASLAGAFNKDEGTIAMWVRVSGVGVWSDATDRRPFYLATDANNRVFFQKNSGNNAFSVQYVAGGTIKTVAITSFSPLTWFHVAATWSKSADQFKLYVNGAQSGATQTALGTWAGALASGNAFVGAAAGPANFMSGNLAHAAIWPTPLSAAQVASLATI